jgi:hypothetical protein
LNTRSIMLAVLVIAICALAVGCGDDNDSASAGSDGHSITTSSLGKKQFIKKANTACSETREGLLEKLSSYAERNKGIPEGVLIADAFRAVMVPAAEEEIAAIRKLGAPEGDEEKIEAILTAQQQGIDEVKQVKRAKTLTEFSDHFQASDEQLKEYGLTICMKG